MSVRQLVTSAALLLLTSCGLLSFGEARVGNGESPDSHHRRDSVFCNHVDGPFDVIIVGAGMAGLATARTLLDARPGICMKIFEKGNDVGGRMKSDTFGGYNIELGANWISGGLGKSGQHPIKNLADQYGIPYYSQWFDDCDVYDAFSRFPTTPIKSSDWWKRWQALLKAMNCANDEGNLRYNAYYANASGSLSDVRVSEVLARCGWNSSSSRVDRAIEAFWFDNDYLLTPSQSSIYNFPEDTYFDYGKSDNFVKGNSISTTLQGLARRYAEGVGNRITFNAAVTKIVYSNTGATVTASGKDYTTKKLIYTPSIGVLRSHEANNVFSPPLTPSSATFPLDMGAWYKVFFKFPTGLGGDFWKSKFHYQWIIIGTQTRNLCSMWLNFEHVDLWPGSRILMCGLDQSAVEAKFGTGTILSASNPTHVNALLEPLQKAFGSKFRNATGPPLITNWLGDDSFLGSWERWAYNDNTLDLGDYYDFIKPRNQTLFFAGSGMCLRYWGFMHGAYFSGVKTANWVLNSLAGNTETPYSPCDDINNIVGSELGG